jgi:hypothetical protein
VHLEEKCQREVEAEFCGRSNSRNEFRDSLETML